MICYFSGTGNSRWAAMQLADKTDDKAVDIIQTAPASLTIETGTRLGLVFPVYAWSYPKIMGDFIKALHIPEGVFIYAVCTCGEECGHTMKKLEKLLGKGLSAKMSLPMPNNYIIGADVDSIDEEKRKIAEADERLERFSAAVNAGESMSLLDVGSLAGLKSSVAAWGFNTFATTDKPFFAGDECIGCSLCEKSCPTDNIILRDKKPVWQGKCIQCLSCINRCPTAAIQYGKATAGRGRYYFGKNSGE